MSPAIQLEDDAYAIAAAYAQNEHCSISTAVSKLVVKSGLGFNKKGTAATKGDDVRFPLVRGARTITSGDVACLEDES